MTSVPLALDLPSVPNLRELGGYRTIDGATVRHGAVLRSTHLGRVADEDARALGSLGLDTVVDLRTGAERDAMPDQVPGDARYLVLDVFADREAHGAGALTTRLGAVMSDADAAREALADGQGAELMKHAYREMIDLPSADASFAGFFRALDSARSRPVLVHCATGKDRTGWACATTLFALGVDTDTIFEDYLLTNERLLPALEPMFAGLEQKGVARELMMPLLGVRREYLETAIDRAEERYGSMDAYLATALGVGDDERARLRAMLTVPSAG